MGPGPSDVDIVFGRAVLGAGLLTRSQLDECLGLQREAQQQGRAASLAQVVLARGHMNRAQYDALVLDLQKRYHGSRSRSTASYRRPSRPTRPLPSDRPASGVAQRGGLEGRGDATTPSGSGRFGPMAGAPASAGPQGLRGPAQASPRPPSSEAPPTPKPARPSHREPLMPPQGLASTPADSGRVSPSGAVSPGAPSVLDSTRRAGRRRDLPILKKLGLPEDSVRFSFGDYFVEGLVAAGGMGVIYRARGPAGQSLALKVLMNVDKATEKQQRRFSEEGRVMASLDHPHIVKVHGSGIYKGIPYIVMDLVDGRDLYQILRTEEWDLRALIEVVAKVCRAVQYAHDKGIVHRDLKPSNVVLDAQREPALTDFGLAKDLQSSFKLTAAGAMVGTPLYLAPEQVAGRAHEADGRVDVYGLGVMLYQVCTGRLPFVGANPYEVYEKIIHEDPKPPRELDPELPEELERVTLQALAKRLEDRFDCPGSLAEQLEGWLSGDPVTAVAPPPGRRYRRRSAPPEADREAGVSLSMAYLAGALLLLAAIAYAAGALRP